MDHSTKLDSSGIFSAAGLVVVLTGGGTGIGRAIATALYSTGASKVFILGRRLEVLQETAKSIDSSGNTVIPVQADVANIKSIAAAVKEVEKHVQHVDVVINNAGVSGPNHNPVHEAKSIRDVQATLLSDWDGWATTFAINSTAVVGVAASFLHLLDAANARRGFVGGRVEEFRVTGEQKGRQRDESKIAEGVDKDDVRTSQIITVSSIAAFNRHITAGVTYAASKAAAAHEGKVLANVLAPWGIRSNVIAPGIFPSQMTEKNLKKEYAVDQIPGHRPGQYEELAGTILYTVGRSGGYLNGNVQVIDGGRLTVMPGTY